MSYGENVKKILFTDKGKDTLKITTIGEDAYVYDNTLVGGKGEDRSNANGENCYNDGIACLFSGTQITSRWTFAKTAGLGTYYNGGNGYMSLDGDQSWDPPTPPEAPVKKTGTTVSTVVKGWYAGTAADLNAAVNGAGTQKLKHDFLDNNCAGYTAPSVFSTANNTYSLDNPNGVSTF